MPGPFTPDRRGLLAAAAASAGLATGLAAAPPALANRRGGVSPIAAYPAPTTIPSPPDTAWFAPAVPAYPQPVSPQRLIEDAKALSDALERHIRLWLAGRESAHIPRALMPPGYNERDSPAWRLVRPQDAAPFVVRSAHQINRDALFGSFPDPNCTYQVALLYAPFGADLIIEGEFPHGRFFDIQVTPSFDPKSYHYDGWAGVGEVPIVDVDIQPEPGHQNPYRVGARRDAKLRSYRVTYHLAIGDPVALNQAFRPPHFRARGNRRVGGAILYQGPWGDPQSQGHRRGRWNHGQIWVRIYGPDADKGPLGGVALPRLWCAFEDGQRFWIQPDVSAFNTRANRTVRPRPTTPQPLAIQGPNIGWSKQAGIFRAIYSGFAVETNWASKDYVRAIDKGVTARGADLPAPNNYEQSATSCTYIDYLVRGMRCARGDVVVLTGRLPTTPRTRNGAPVMQNAQARYWSLTGYVVPEGWDMLSAVSDPNYPAGLCAHCIMDEDVVLQDSRRFVIALSRPQDRPRNATPSAGVTWADWGEAGTISWTLRWLSVGPEWTVDFAPTPQRLGRRAEWAEPTFDPQVLPNGHGGAIGEYCPKVHKMSRSAFEALGSFVRMQDVPTWRG